MKQLTIEVENQEALAKLSKIKGITITSESNIIPSNVQKIIDGIIEDFDFERVHVIMKYMDWEWCGEGVPSIEKLKECAVDLLQNAYIGFLKQNSNEEYSSKTGGFEAYYINIEGENCFELKFVLTSVNNYY